MGCRDGRDVRAGHRQNRGMKAWEIYSYEHPGWPEPHPAVIVSHPDRVTLKPEVTILLCSSKPATRPAKPHEVILDGGDGLDWPTVCKCDLLYTLPKSALIARRGDRRAAAANRRNDQSCHGMGLTTKAENDFSFSAFDLSISAFPISILRYGCFPNFSF